ARLDPTYLTAQEAFSAAKAAGAARASSSSAASASAAAGQDDPVFVDPWLGQQSGFTARRRRKRAAWPTPPQPLALGLGALLLAAGIVQVFRTHRPGY